MTKGHFDALLDWKNNMNINIDLDLGNVWEMLSAVGTIAAVIVSLCWVSLGSANNGWFVWKNKEGEPINIYRNK